MMHIVALSLAAAASALAVATPASAQYYPVPAPGYGVPGYGAPAYGQRVGHFRALQARVNHLQREINRLAQYRMISRGEYNDLRKDVRHIESRLRRDARDGYGLNRREIYETERRIARLEQKIARDVRDGRRGRHRW